MPQRRKCTGRTTSPCASRPTRTRASTDYPVAASQPVYVIYEAAQPTPTETPAETPTPEVTPTETPEATPTVEEQATTAPTATPTVEVAPTEGPTAEPTSSVALALVEEPKDGASLNGPVDILGTAIGQRLCGL